jgi:hypothetical protein
VRSLPLDVDDEADAAGVVLVPGIVKAGGGARLCDKGHGEAFIADLDSEEKYNDHI